jgi:cellobiose phosphorylase
MGTLTNNPITKKIDGGGIQLYLLESGDVFKWMHGDHQINLLQGNLIDGMIANIYLRETLPHGYRTTRLMGIHSPSYFQITADGAIYEGKIWDVFYQIHLIIDHNTWFYQIHLSGTNITASYELFYGQDVGIAHPFGILSNEAYTSQYIDHQVFETSQGFTLLSRQNQGLTHYLQLGCDFPTVGYATDAMQFFGLSYKLTHEPEIYTKKHLPNQNYQYEFAYLALQTETFHLNESTMTVTFYGHSHQEADLFLTKLLTLPNGFPARRRNKVTLGVAIKSTLSPLHPIAGLPLTKEQFQTKYPTATLIEREGDEILSGFLPDHTHIVTRAKELLVERPHGHILLSGDILHASEDVFASTAYMMGIFGSHTVYGNTNFHKLTGDLRNPLNLHTISGTRIYVKMDGEFRLLGLPSIMEIGLEMVRWIYRLAQDTFTITLAVDGNEPGSALVFKSERKIKYDILLSQQFLLDTNEYQHPINFTYANRELIIAGSSSSLIAQRYPNLRYRLTSNHSFDLLYLNDFIPLAKSDAGMVFLSFTQIDSLRFTTEATNTGTFKTTSATIATTNEYATLINNLVPLKFENTDKMPAWESYCHLVPWYVHDALVHFASPHGLEQYNGAAWGTRDVLQGPFELFLAAQRFDLNREILLKVYARQFIDSKEFPQWFMFDNYRYIQAHESHGDVLVWPLKALADYLEATNDVAILEVAIPYMDKRTGTFTEVTASLKDHVWDILTTLLASVIPGTHLPSYGGGDWDDTLQPANAALTKKMVSGWTVALLYEALKGLESYPLFEEKRQMVLTDFIVALKRDYHNYLIVDGIPAGFVIFHDDHREVLLHPQDKTTGLQYRLLPFNRGIISNMFEPNQIPGYQAIIKQYLRHPDGVRLMNTAVTYQGGKKTYFQRAETAANFGREISIQYVHAHIRYIEAMCRIHDGEEAWWGLNVVNPIAMKEYVSNAMLRQRNVYFSSSDAAFLDRYKANREFEKIRQGTIPVKAGWRLYSSGPGIYLSTLIRRFLGIHVYHGKLLIDPQQAQALDGLIVQYHDQGTPITITYQTQKTSTSALGVNNIRAILNK